MQNKRQLIDDIRKYNKTVAPQFLVQFDDDALQQYLEHLKRPIANIRRSRPCSAAMPSFAS